MKINHKGPGQPSHWSGFDAEELVQDIARGHHGLLPLYVASQDEVDYLQALGLLHGTEVEVYVWGSNPWTNPTLNNFYTYLEGVMP